MAKPRVQCPRKAPKEESERFHRGGGGHVLGPEAPAAGKNAVRYSQDL